jgi:uncharacterized protein
LPSLGIFHRSKKEEEPKAEEKPEPAPTQATPPSQPEPEVPATAPVPEPAPPIAPSPVEVASEAKTYLRAMPLKDLADLETIKTEVRNGNILILRITPLANKSIEDVKQAVNDLFSFAESINGDIARLGEERIVVCPPKIRIWREKAPAQSEPLPTAA